MEKEFDLGWGNPYFLLEILDQETISFKKSIDYRMMTYEADVGNPKLIKRIKEITSDLTGNDYKYILITNGATQALNIIMRVWERDRNLLQCTTSRFGYPYYPGMIDKTTTMHHNQVEDLANHKLTKDGDDMMIIDSPSNPFGVQISGNIFVNGKSNIVWDAVYHNPIYAASKFDQPIHEVHVNSFSKLLGVTGARVGWIATNDEFDYKRFCEESLMENATVSRPGQDMVLDILKSINLEKFMTKGRIYLDNNRETMNKLSSLLGEDVPHKGMFYCVQTDQKMFDIFDKAGVKYVRIDKGSRKFIRLSLGQTCDILSKAVKAVKNIDRSS